MDEWKNLDNKSQFVDIPVPAFCNLVKIITGEIPDASSEFSIQGQDGRYFGWVIFILGPLDFTSFRQKLNGHSVNHVRTSHLCSGAQS